MVLRGKSGKGVWRESGRKGIEIMGKKFESIQLGRSAEGKCQKTD